MLRSTQRNAAVALAAVTLTGSFGVFANLASAEVKTDAAITGLSVAKGSTAGGTSTLITGTGFLKINTPGVMFGDTAASNLIVLSDTQIAAVAPALPAEATSNKVDVTLTDGDDTYAALTGAAATKDDFSYLAPYNATVATGSLMNPLGGSKLVVTSSAEMGACGAEFVANKVTATIGGVLAPVTCVNPTTVSLAVPVGVPSATGSKVVLLHDGVAGSPSSAAKYAAVVGGIDKPVGPVAGGGTVIVTGKGFRDAEAWKFGTEAATCTPTGVAAEADTKISCVVPAQTAEAFAGGAVSVTFDPAGAIPFGATSKATYTYSDLG